MCVLRIRDTSNALQEWRNERCMVVTPVIVELVNSYIFLFARQGDADIVVWGGGDYVD